MIPSEMAVFYLQKIKRKRKRKKENRKKRTKRKIKEIKIKNKETCIFNIIILLLCIF